MYLSLQMARSGKPQWSNKQRNRNKAEQDVNYSSVPYVFTDSQYYIECDYLFEHYVYMD